MATCARCGSKEAGPPQHSPHREYEYCDGCNELFDKVWNDGVVVRSRHGNQAFERMPYTVTIRSGDVPNPAGNAPQNQTEALAKAKRIMKEYDLPGLFVYQKTGSEWLLSEYLESHPSIADDVEEMNSEDGTGLFSGLFG